LPKVKEGYFEEKKNSILDVAEKICMTKPLNKITMKDIITESGLSTGAVYSSFSDIDEIIIALINRLSNAIDFERIISQALQENDTPEKKIESLLNCLFDLIKVSAATYGKVISEVDLLAMEMDEERAKKYTENLDTARANEYVVNTLIQVIEEYITVGYFKPMVSKESIYSMFLSFFDGLIRTLSLMRCNSINDTPLIPDYEKATYEEDDLPKAISASVIFLLNRQKEGLNE